MNGAESLVRTLVDGGVDVCFANPGTSEMHFVAALDRVPGMRCVLGLFEGVVTGAADGYARMAGKPAATLLHCGPGLGNAAANMHNARRANSPMVNIVGDHATYHRRFDAPLGLATDTELAAKPFSHWVRTAVDARTVAADGAAAIAAANTPPGQVTTLILPANTAWDEADGPAKVPPVPSRNTVPGAAIDQAAKVLRLGQPTVILLGGPGVSEEGLRLAGRIGLKTGAKVMVQGANARMARGAGRLFAERVPYPVDQALAAMKDFAHAILIGARAPVAFFAYPGKPGTFLPRGCQAHEIARLEDDVIGALRALADALDAKTDAPTDARVKTALATGQLTAEKCWQSIAALLPENAIVADESITSGRGLFGATRAAPPHDWLQNLGGSIGLGTPMATGAAVACPDRKVVTLQADGSLMYTLQALWTQARENLDVTTVVWSNRSYAILNHELRNVGAHNPGRTALDMLDLSRPNIDFVALAKGMGVPGGHATTMEEFNRHLAAGLASSGPYLVDVALA